MFGTFLFNNEKERQSEQLMSETVSVWSLLESMKPELSNKLYTPGLHKVSGVHKVCVRWVDSLS